VTRSAEDQRIRQLRPAKRSLDAWRPIGVQMEEERNAEGELVPCLTLFLTGRECPFTCVFCDLWQYTLDGPTPPGAIPAQISWAFEEVGKPPAGATIKLYNASNFFDDKAVPRADWSAIAELLDPFSRVVVESHPKLVGDSCVEFAKQLEGRLEVAMGLETVHPVALPRLNKKLTLRSFDRAAALLHSVGVGIRSFVLVGAPYIPAAEAVDWAIRSADYAQERGSKVVSLIPVRSGYGEMQRLADLGVFSPPTAKQLEEALDGALRLNSGVVLADLWDAERLAGCAECRMARIERMDRLNRGGGGQPPVTCQVCDEVD
jgi:radical SAM enzyme (TIGR01210 family)